MFLLCFFIFIYLFFEKQGDNIYVNNLENTMEHIRCCVNIYKYQYEQGMYYLHEHPQSASSWKLATMTKLIQRTSPEFVVANMCAFGMHDRDHQGGGLVKKPTGFMTNATMIAKKLAKPCSGDHRHIVLIGHGRARRAQVYPNELCKQIILKK